MADIDVNINDLTVATSGNATDKLIVRQGADTEDKSIEAGKLPISTATQTALDTKGDLFDADLRSGNTSTVKRLEMLSGIATSTPTPYATGDIFDQSLHASNSGSANGATAASRLVLSPFAMTYETTINRMAISITSNSTSGVVKIGVYSDLNGTPDALLYETDELSTTSVGVTEDAVDFTFLAGVQYWIATHSNQTFSCRVLNASACLSYGLSSTSITVPYSCLLLAQPYASGFPDPFNNASAVFQTYKPASIRMTVA